MDDESEKVKSEKWSESESIFGPLYFFNFRYIKVGVWGNNNIAWLNFTPPWLVLQFMEYSRNIPWNIPYSKILDILIVLQFFRNIPRIFHIPPNSIFFLFPFYLEYSIFQKLKNHLVEAKFWNIPYSIKCHK